MLGFAGYAYAESNKDYEKELSEAGLFDQKTGNITQKAIGEFAKLDTGKKKEFIDALSHVVFKEEDATISHAKSVIDEKNGSYTLVVDTKEHAAKWGTAIAQKKHLFDDELAKLGIRVDIVDKETYQEKK